jgi:hypothetical protein
MKKLLRLVLCAIVVVSAGCATVDPPRELTAGWPKLDTEIHVVDTEEAFESICGKPQEGHIVTGCVFISFSRKTCTMFFARGRDAPWIRDDTYKYCLGYDRKAWKKWKEWFKERN